MKKTFILSILILFCSFSIGQDLITLKHTNYTSTFSKSLKYPVLVEWWLTKEKIGCSKPIPRKDNFKPDPDAKEVTDLANDYVGSGLDRGHNMPAAENQCQGDKVQDECFYFSNMTPQYHSLNAGLWKSVEVMERRLSIENDSVHVWCGSIGKVKEIGPNKVAVPKQCWKVIYVKKKNEWMAFIFDNVNGRKTSLHENQVDVEYISSLTGFKFLK
jgi:endonuclease G